MKRSLILILLSTAILGGLSSDSPASETALSLPLSTSNPSLQLSDSLLLPQTPTPSTGADVALVAALDGTIHLIDTKIGKVRWSFSSGQPIYSSYQTPFNNNDNASASEYFLDVGEDWQLYVRSKRVDKKVKALMTPDEYIRKTPNVTENGGVTLGNKRTTVFVLDAKSGRLVFSYRSDDSGSKLGSENDEENPVLEVHTSKGLLETASKNSKTVQHLLYIMRTDYVIQYYSSGEVLWNLAFADIEAEFRCQGKQNSLTGNELIAGYLGDSESPLPCQTRVLVNRLRDNSLLEFLSLPGGVSKLLRLLPDSSQNLHLGTVYQLASAGKEDRHISKALPGRNDITALSLQPAEFENSGALALTGGSVNEVNNMSIFVERIIGFFFTAILMLENYVVVLLFIAILSIIGFFFYRSKQQKLNKQAEEPKVQAGITRKKKSRRSGNNRNSTTSGKIRKSISNEIVDSSELPYVDGNEKKSLLTYTDLVDGHLDGRRIGKLLVSNKEIAKGSNGTVVLEGIYDGRPVAVKRLVQTHHDVALKEIQNLIASDQHPNIVRWYGVEFDQDFVYLSLERCTCSLNDFIYVSSGTFQSKTISEDQDSNSLVELTVRLRMLKENNKDFELWKPNGYPSTQLLKLMRDMVSGLSHLHDLGIIHRDLKPQNVLIIKERSLCAKLSDMGISKRLHGDMTSLTQNATGYGSSGWQAPEQLLQGRQTRAVDLFSLGCVLFFCITGGKHPYGDSFERDANIVNDRKDLFLVETIPEAVDLFSHLLDPKPDMRPKAQDVLYHPFFWTTEMRLSFLRDVSDRLELEKKEESSELLEALEGIATVALNGKWDEKMDSAFMDDILQRRRYKYDSVRDLLRVIRNKSSHYQEFPQEIQELLGPFPEGFYNYFCSRFPKLLIEVYNVIYKYCKEEKTFQKYIKSDLF